MNNSNQIIVEVKVPVKIAPEDRCEFERAITTFMFGYDRVRPELHAALKKHGVDINQLASLSAPENISVCPTPNALEFIPSEQLIKIGKKHGTDFTKGGELMVSFDYDAVGECEFTGETLDLRLGLPDGFKDISDDEIGNITRVLFGDCQLAKKAQDYLRTHGVDLVEIAAEKSMALQDGKVPPTSRVRPEVAETLDRFGLNTDRLGQINIGSSEDLNTLMEGIGDPRVMWKKTTCC